MKNILLLLVMSLVFAGCTQQTTSTSSPTSAQSSNLATATSDNSTNTSQSNSKTYTMAEVEKHDSAKDCWTVVNGGVYELTSFIPQHEGGIKIVQACGTDATQLFQGEREHTAEADAQLAKLKIGTLQGS